VLSAFTQREVGGATVNASSQYEDPYGWTLPDSLTVQELLRLEASLPGEEDELSHTEEANQRR